MPVKFCVFDAYGTLFDVTAAARDAARQPGSEAWASRAPGLAANWRRKQLEYTWLRSLADAHVDFWQITQDALDWAMETEGLRDAGLRQLLLDLYWALAPFPEVPSMLAELEMCGMARAILSNGSRDMLEAAVHSAGIEKLLDAVLSVDDVSVFKPHSSVYAMVGQRFDAAPDEVLFVSSNGWDACSAAAFGFQTVWVNRDGAVPDRLHGRPDHVLADLAALPDLVSSL